MLKDLLRPCEVAELFDVCIRTIWLWTRSGKLPEPIRIGKTVRWRRSEIEQHLASRPQPKPKHKRYVPKPEVPSWSQRR